MAFDLAATFNGAVAAFNSGDVERALSMWTSCVPHVDPSSQQDLVGKLHSARANACMRLSRWGDAIRALDSGMDDGGLADAATYHKRAVCLRNTGRNGECVEWEIAALNADPDNYDARRGLAAGYMALEQWDDAAEAARDACLVNEKDPAAAVDLGFVLLRLKKPGEAATEFGRARELGDGSAQTARLYASALAQMAEQLGQAGDLEEAAAAFEAAAEVEPTVGRVYNAAVLHMRAGERGGESAADHPEFAQALSCFRRAITMQPDFVQAHTALSTLLVTCGAYAEACAAYEAAAACMGPQAADADARFLYNYGVAVMKNGGNGAAELFQRALRAHPGFREAAVALSIAQEAAAAGRQTTPEDAPAVAPDRPAAPPEVERPYSPSQWFRAEERTPEEFEGYGGEVHGLESVCASVRASDLPEGVDPTHREAYLPVDEFREAFRMSKRDFYRLPKWKRNELKRGRRLF